MFAHQSTASREQRLAASELFTQIKYGDVREAASMAMGLLVSGRQLEVQHFGFQLLQTLVSAQWEKFSADEHIQLARLALSLFQQVGRDREGWAVRSKAALVLALVAKRQGPSMVQELLPQLLTIATESPTHTEMVCMVLRLEAEELTQYTDDLDADQKRELLAALLHSLDSVLPFLQKTLQDHFVEALAAQGRGDSAAAALHDGVVTAALEAVQAYVEWAPLGRVGASGLLSACAYFLSVPSHRMGACGMLRQVSARKQLQEDTSVYNSVMAATGEALMQAAGSLLSPGNASQLEYDGDSDEFGQYVCETMAGFGTSHLHTLAPDKKILFLQQMLAFTQHSYMLLAAKAMPFWTSLLTSSERSAARIEPLAPENSPIPLECVAVLMDLAGEQLRKGVHLVESDTDLPPFFDTFDDYREFCLEYRSSLGKIARLTACLLPEPALAAASRRLSSALGLCSVSGTSIEEQQSQFEAAVVFLDSVVTQVSAAHLSDAKAGTSAADKTGILRELQALLQQLLQARMSDPMLINWHCRALEAFARCVSAFPDLMPIIMQKVFDMFSYVQFEGDPQDVPPAHPPPGWKDAFSARHRVAGTMVAYAKAAGLSMRPHLTTIAARMEEMWAAHKLGTGERNVLCDAMLAASASGGPELRTQVVEWVLGSIRSVWVGAAWQQHLASSSAFLARFMPLRASQGTIEIEGRQPRWELFHHVHMVSRTVKRMPACSSLTSAESIPGSAGWHVLNGHLAWMLGPLLQMFRCLHSLYTPQAVAALSEVSTALEMGPREKALYLKNRAKAAAAAQSDEEVASTLAGSTPAGLRTWIRQMREELYQTLGTIASQISGFYQMTALLPAWQAALVGDLAVMPTQHLRMLIRHIIIPLVKACPPTHRNTWLLPILAPLLPHVLARLSADWTRVVANSGTQAAAAAVNGVHTSEAPVAAESEVIAERLLRELTAEHITLLTTLQDTGSGGIGAETPMVWLAREAPETALCAAVTATAALWWPDEMVGKAANFCRAVVAMGAQDARFGSLMEREMLRGAFAAVAASGVAQRADLLHLARDILALRLPLPPTPRQELLRLPSVNEDVVAGFEAAMMATRSDKDQRNLIKRLLFNSGVEDLQKSLGDWRPVMAVVNLAEPKMRVRHASVDEEGTLFHIQS
ncbi:Exportin-5 [Coccomyxa sp. Obi]|nr:Exportin-5 [Coccomyxa sp. Obi]